jgi:manganese/zinc/iron transport system permease protein
MNPDELWILLTGSLVGVACTIVGVPLVLRRMTMIGDAISHTVLLGIVLGFLVSGSRSIIPMGVGALLVGLCTALFARLLHSLGGVQQDASIGVTFTGLFALGVILFSAFAGEVDLDQDCVLFGDLAYSTFDKQTFLGIVAPRATWILLGVTLINSIFTIVGYRPLKLLCFDGALASVSGYRVEIWQYLLMALVSLTTVASFESVGAILVVAFLVIPANTGYLIARSFAGMFLLSMLASVLAAIGGFFLAKIFDASLSAGIGTASALIFAVVFLIQALPRSRSVAVK